MSIDHSKYSLHFNGTAECPIGRLTGVLCGLLVEVLIVEDALDRAAPATAAECKRLMTFLSHLAVLRCHLIMPVSLSLR